MSFTYYPRQAKKEQTGSPKTSTPVIPGKPQVPTDLKTFARPQLSKVPSLTSVSSKLGLMSFGMPAYGLHRSS